MKLDPKNNNDDYGFAPYVSYKNMDEFVRTRIGDLNKVFSKEIIERMGTYLERTDVEPYYAEYLLQKALKDRAVHDIPSEKDYLYMDHAYFSGLLMAKNYIARHKDIKDREEIPEAVMDAFTAIILHNSLFKFTLRSLLHTREKLKLTDG